MANPSSSKIVLLIVDPSGEARHFYGSTLQAEERPADSYQFLEADTLDKAIPLWQDQQPEVVLLAMDLPDGSGLEFLAYLQERYPNQTLPVIGIGHQEDTEQIVQAMKLGASDFLVREKMNPSSLGRAVLTTRKQWQLSQRIHQFQEREHLANQVAERIRRSFKLEDILQTCVQGVQKLLSNDRVVIYRFNPDMSGIIVAEQVMKPWMPTLNGQVVDTCFQQNLGGDYRTGRIFQASDIYQAGLTDCHVELLERFQVRANLVVPILLHPPGSTSALLWGLLIAHQCDGPRVWDSSEVTLLQQIATQLAIAVQQSKTDQRLRKQFKELTQWRTRYELAEQANSQMIYEYYFTDDSVTWGANAQGILGYPPALLPQHLADWLALVDPQDRPRFLAEMKRATEANQGFHLEYRFRHHQGHSILLEDRNQWLYNAQGEQVGVIGMITDITARKQTETLLAASEAKLKQLAIAQPGTLYTLLRRLDGSYAFTDLSPQSETLFEVAIEDALANPDLILGQIHPEDLAEYVQLVEESQSNLSTFRYEFRIITPSGRLKWLQANSIPVQLATGEVAWYGITLEVTDRKIQEAQLQESESRFRQLAENIHQVFYLTDTTKQELLYISPSYETIWQRSRESIYAQPASYVDAVLETDRPLVMQAYQDQLEGQNTEVEYRIVRPDGSIRWILDRTFIVQTQNPSFNRVCGIAEDITERKQIEIALQQETEFNQLIAEISRRLVNVHHANLDAETQRTLESIGKATQSDTCVLFQLDFQTQTLSLEYEYNGLDTQEYKTKTQALPFDAFPWLVSSIQSQKVCYVSDMSQAPPEAAIDVSNWQRFGLQSILAIPLLQKGEAIGFLGVASSSHPMNWTTESIRLLTILTQTLANTRERVQAEIELKITSERLKEAQRIACIGNWELNHLNGNLYWSEEVFTIFELDFQTFTPSYEAFLALVHPEDRQDLAQTYTQHLQDGVPYCLIHRLALPSGQVKYLQEQCETVFDESGQPLLSKGTVQDVTALKQAENQLQILNQDLEKQVRQRTQEIWDFKLALDESALVAITDAQGVITYVNDRFCEMSGYSREEFLGRTHRFLKSGEHPPAFYRQLWQTITAGQVWRGEICNQKKNGDRYWLSSTIVPFLDAQGEPYQYLAVRFDITARKQAEMQLQKLSERLSIALKAGEIGCWEWNIVKNTLTWDERMFELYGYPPTTKQLPYRIWSQGVYEPDRAATERLLHQTVAGEAEYDTEFRVLHPDGSIGFIKAYGLVIRNPEGQPQKMIGVNFDITQQKAAELELRHQAEKETLLRQISLRIRQTLDLSTTFNTACQEVREFLQVDRVAIFRFYPDSGYDDGEFVAESLNEGFSSVMAIHVHDHWFGEGYSHLYTQGHFQCVEDVRQSDLQDCHKAILSQFEIRANLVMPLLQGQELWGLLCIHTCTAPRHWQPKEVELVQQISQQLAIAIQQANLFTQLTERNEQLALSNEALARATRLKDEFLANMSHELRTPLTSILGMSEALQEKTFGEITARQEKALKQIEKSGRHLLNLINDILDFSRIESGRLDLDLIPVNLTQVCHDSLAMVQQIAQDKDLHLNSQIATPLGFLLLDERRIFQCVVNLLSNALKFTPSGGTVTISIHQENEEVAISVRDTGIGIDPQHFNKLFEPFEQIDSSLSRQYEGTGLGLALVKRLVEAHQGRVTVTSELGKGSCFTLYFPYHPLSALTTAPLLSETNALDAQGVPTATRSPVIVLADDNEANRDTLQDYLSQKGYQMFIAHDGEAALSLVHTHLPDLILMDIQMPKLNGLEAIAQIRSNPDIAHIPIIALTALAMPGDKERCLEAGANDYLTKPIRFKLLIETIQKLLLPSP